MTNNFYAILGLVSGATPAAVRRAYRKAALLAHPDKGGIEKDFHSVALAFEALSSAPVRAVDHGLNSAGEPTVVAGKNGSSRRSWTRPSSSRGKHARNAGSGTRRSSHTPVAQAFGRLQAVLQLMNAPQRRACIPGMAAHVRSALLLFMKHPRKSNAIGPTTDATDELPRRRVRKLHVGFGSSTVRVAGLCTLKTAPRAKHKVQVYANALRLYTSEQTEVEPAIEYHICSIGSRKRSGRNAMLTQHFGRTRKGWSRFAVRLCNRAASLRKNLDIVPLQLSKPAVFSRMIAGLPRRFRL